MCLIAVAPVDRGVARIQVSIPRVRRTILRARPEVRAREPTVERAIGIAVAGENKIRHVFFCFQNF